MAEPSKDVSARLDNTDTDKAEEVIRARDEDVEGDEEDEDEAVPENGTSKKKKPSRKAKVKSAIGLGKDDEGVSAKDKEMIERTLASNPALKSELAKLDMSKVAEVLKGMQAGDIVTGMGTSAGGTKDMASYKFWQTQPVPRFDEEVKPEGTIKPVDPEKIAKAPRPLMAGFAWVTMDLNNSTEIREVHELLTSHYVEDDEARFRLTYSDSFLNWALKPPGWHKDWHIGVRASASRKLVAFISAVPVDLRVKENTIKCSEVNFLCIHKKLRSKRLAPLLIEEVTRQSHLHGIYHAIYTAGTILPKPVATCRYYHRSLDWSKLFDIGFAGLPHGSTKQRQIARNALSETTNLPGLRKMEKKDIPQVHQLLDRYLKRFAMAPLYSEEELDHWFLQDPSAAEQVVWAYVVEDAKTHKITDLTTFFCLESSVIGNARHGSVRAAYSFYYATEAAFEDSGKGLKARLNTLINDSLILAKKANFDVFNALTLLDNPLFLDQQKFGVGDGTLHYYLFNYRTRGIEGGLGPDSKADATKMGGVGMVLL